MLKNVLFKSGFCYHTRETLKPTRERVTHFQTLYLQALMFIRSIRFSVSRQFSGKGNCECKPLMYQA